MVKLKCLLKGHTWAVVSTKDGLLEKCKVCGTVRHEPPRRQWTDKVILKDSEHDGSK